MEDFLYRYRVLHYEVIDADTVRLTIDHGKRITSADVYRLFGPDPGGKFGVNAPEMNTPEGRAAKEWLVARLAGAELVARTVRDKSDKYGRYLVVLWAKRAGDVWVNINAALLEAGHASLKQY